MKSNGQAFSIESGMSLGIIILFLIISNVQIQGKGEEVLYITSLQHDLLKTQISQKDFTLEGLSNGFLFAFPNKNGYVEINGNRKHIGNTGEMEISSTVVFFTPQKIEMKVAVFI